MMTNIIRKAASVKAFLLMIRNVTNHAPAAQMSNSPAKKTFLKK